MRAEAGRTDCSDGTQVCARSGYAPESQWNCLNFQRWDSSEKVMPACLCFTAAEGSGSPAGIHANMVLMWWMEGRKGEVKLTAEAGNTAWWENKLENCLLFYTILHSFRALLRWQAY